MSKAVKPVPEGFHTVTPHLTVRDAAKAIAFYKAAFGAQERNCLTAPDGRVVHAELKFGDSIVFLADEFPGMPGGTVAPETVGGRRTGGINLYVEDADTLFEQAVRAGATPVMPVADQFWGDRHGAVLDPFGQLWSVSTHKEDLTEQEIERRSQEFFARMAAQQKTA